MNAFYNKHYITTDIQGRITSGWSDGPHPNRDTTNAICINEQGGYQFRLIYSVGFVESEAEFPTLYSEENPPLRTEDGIPLYIWGNGVAIRRTEEEIAADRLPGLKAAKLAELSAACGEVITAGFDIELGGKIEHFDLRLEDQNNIDSLFDLVKLGGTEFPYQADGGRCRFYTAQEIVQIYIKSKTTITAQTTYHNALKEYVQGLDSVEAIEAVQYGMDLPEPLASKVADTLVRASAQMAAVLTAMGGGDADAV